MAEASRKGLVTEYERKEKGPHRAKVGGKVVKIWPTEQDGTPNPALAVIAAGGDVEVHGYEKAEDYNGRQWTAFYATWAGPISNGNGAASEHRYVGRDPGQADQWLAARHAVSCAIEILGQGKDLGAYMTLADQVLNAGFELAESFRSAQETPKADANPF